MQCPSCGNEVEESEKYCSECGEPLDEESIKKTGERGLDYRMKTYRKGAPLMAANIAVYFLGIFIVLNMPLGDLEASKMFLISLLPLIPLNIFLYIKYLS